MKVLLGQGTDELDGGVKSSRASRGSEAEATLEGGVLAVELSVSETGAALSRPMAAMTMTGEGHVPF